MRKKRDENDTLCHLMARSDTTAFDKVKLVAAVYGVTTGFGTFAYALYGIMDLKFPYRAYFHDIVFYQFNWIPNALYMYLFALFGYAGIIGTAYKCLMPKLKPKDQASRQKRMAHKRRTQIADKILLAMLVLGLTCQIAIGGFVFSYSYILLNDHQEIETQALEGMRSSISAYGDVHFMDLSRNLDRFQSKSKCCGSFNATDWITYNPLMAALGTLPQSCCQNTTDDCVHEVDRVSETTEGCAGKILGWIKRYLKITVILTGAVTGIEVSFLLIFLLILCGKWCGERAFKVAQEPKPPEQPRKPRRQSQPKRAGTQDHVTFELPDLQSASPKEESDTKGLELHVDSNQNDCEKSSEV